jgi:hypothetical protein
MKGFCELLSWVSTKALVGMRCLTINTRADRVAISSVITRIFLNSVQCWTITFQPVSKRHSWFIYVVHSAHVPVISCIIYYYYSVYFVVVWLFFHVLFKFCSIRLFCSLFIRKIFNSDPGLYSRYFALVVKKLPSPSMQVNKHHTSDCTVFVLVLERMAYYDHRHRRDWRKQYSPRCKASRGQDTTFVKNPSNLLNNSSVTQTGSIDTVP